MDIITQEQTKEAKVKILQAFDKYRQTQQGQRALVIYEKFATSYNNCQLDLDPALYKQIPHVSRPSLYSWQRGKHLGTQPGRKINKFKILDNPAALHLVLTLLKKDPEISARKIHKHLQDELPGLFTLSATIRFVQRLRETSKQSLDLRKTIAALKH